MDHHWRPKTAYCDCICQLLRAEFCRKLAFPGHSPAVRYSEVILPVGCARSALGCSSAKRSRSRLRGSRTSRHPKFGNITTGGFTPVLAKHSKSFSLIDCISVGVDRMQRNCEPILKSLGAWQEKCVDGKVRAKAVDTTRLSRANSRLRSTLLVVRLWSNNCALMSFQ